MKNKFKTIACLAILFGVLLFYFYQYYLLLFMRTTFSEEREEHIVCQTKKPAVWTKNMSSR